MKNLSQKTPIVVNDEAALVRRLPEFVQSETTSGRKIIAIAGPPGAGKSTLMSSLLNQLKTVLGADAIAGLPMDGYHLDNHQLERNGSLALKGAPHTFDIGGLKSLLERLHSGESPIYAPEFDRASDLSRNCSIKIEQSHNVVFVEGNYLLLNQPGWQELAKYFALTICIDVPMNILCQRLVSRWQHYGLSEDDAQNKAMGNDIPNAKTVVEQSIAADIIYQPESQI